MRIALSSIFFILLLLYAGQQACFAGDSATISVSATILSKNQCKFNKPSSQPLAFGTLDPLNAVDVNAQVTFSFVCKGSSDPAAFSISQNGGLNPGGPGINRMVSAAGAFLPYSLALSPANGSAPKNVAQTLTITGTVRATDYRTAFAGDYSDTVTLTIQP